MTITAELADGRKLEFPDGTDPNVIQSTVKKLVATAQTQIPDTLGGKIGQAVTDVAANLAGNAVATPLGGLAGLMGAALPGEPGQGASVSETVRNALTPAPQSQAGNMALNAVTYPFQKLSEAADYLGGKVAEKYGPGAGTAINTAVNMAPALVTKMSGNKAENVAQSIRADVSKRNDLSKVRNESITPGLDKGYVLPPDQVNPTFISNRLQGVAGKAAIKQEAAIRNQEVTNNLMREELGIAENVPLRDSLLDKLASTAAEPYREVSAISPVAKQTLEKLQDSRTDANDLWKAYGKDPKPENRRAALAMDAKADMLEGVLERIASRSGNPDLIQQLRDARKYIAKVNDVKRALNDSTGNVDAQMIGRMYDKNAKRFSGNFEVVGKFANAVKPELVREATKVEAPGVSKGEAISGALLAAAGHAAFGPVGFAAAALPFLSPITRAGLLSEPYQSAFVRPGLESTGLAQAVFGAVGNPATPYFLSSLANPLRNNQ